MLLPGGTGQPCMGPITFPSLSVLLCELGTQTLCEGCPWPVECPLLLGTCLLGPWEWLREPPEGGEGM